MSSNSNDNMIAAENEGNAPVVYCFGYEKQLHFKSEYRYFVLFMQVENGVASKVVLSMIDRERRNLEGWRALVKKAADKINDSKYILFKNTSFNFVMDIKDILPNTTYCSNIGVIPYDEKYRAETLALANRVNSALIGFRAGADITATFASFAALFKEIGAVEVSVV